MRTRLLILALLITTPTLARSRPQLRHQLRQVAKPAAAPNLAQINSPAADTGCVFATQTALIAYVQDVQTVGNSGVYRSLLASQKLVRVPNGTRIEITASTLLNKGTGKLTYIPVKVLSGEWIGRSGWVMWYEVAALPVAKGASASRKDDKPHPPR
jgi:hypothetical protein